MSNPAVGMPCPTCRVPLVMSERQGVEIDYCPQCRGVWLDRGELDKIIERSGREQQAAPAPAPPAPHYPPQGYAAPQGYAPPQQHYPYKKRKSFIEELFD
jgi:uncharacterized protein